MKQGVVSKKTRDGQNRLNIPGGGDYALQKVPFQFGTATVLQLLMERKVDAVMDSESRSGQEAVWGFDEVAHISWGKFLDNFRKATSFIRFHLKNGNSLYFTEPFWLWQTDGQGMVIQGKKLVKSSNQILSLVERRGFVHHLM